MVNERTKHYRTQISVHVILELTQSNLINCGHGEERTRREEEKKTKTILQ